MPGSPTIPASGPGLVIATSDRRDPAEIGAVAAAYWHGIASSRAQRTILDGPDSSVPLGNDRGTHQTGAGAL